MDDSGMIDHQEKQALLRRFQSELFSFEGEKGSFERKRDDALAEVRRLKQNIAHLEIDLEREEQAIVAADREILLMKDEMSRLKKKMDAL